MFSHLRSAVVAALAAPCLLLAQAGQRPAVDIVVAATTDVHGRLRGWDYYSNAPDTSRGLARAATIVDSVRDANPGRVILVDAGDLLQGNPLTYVAARVQRGGEHPVMAAMNAMRYDAAALGNHEFNYGVPTLRSALGQARFPFLAANLRVLGPGGRLPVSGSTLVRRAGVLVGIVGATTPGANVWDRDNLRGRLVVEDIVPAVRREVDAVRRRGAAMVVVVTHSGLGEPASFDTVATGLPSENVAARLAREVPGIDLIVYGHSHRQQADTTINGVMLMQPRNWATSVAVATVSLERYPQGWRRVSHRGTLVQSAGHTEHPAVVRAVERQHRATVAWVNTSLGSTPVAWSADSARVVDTPIIDFILEVQRRVTGAQLSSTAAFDVNASLDAGDITIAEVARLYPYDNTLRAIRLSGRQLREYIEHSARYYRTAGSPEAERSPVDPAIPGFNFDIVAGADYEIDISRPAGSRVTTLSVAGRAVTDADTFTMALNNYRQSGGGGFAMLAGAPVIHDRGEEIRDLLIDEVRRARVLRPGDYHTRNWRLSPPAAVAAAYQAIHADAFNQPSLRTEGPVAGSHLSTGRWLRVIGTNDFHGGLDPGDFNASGVVRGGIAHLIGAIEQARSECRPPTCHSVWIDGGDQWQGSPASNSTYGRTVVEVFNRFNLAASALGNHEFDWGLDTLQARMREARYRFMAVNVTDTLGNDIDWIPNDTLIDLGAIKVGVIGVLTVATPTATRFTNVAGFHFRDPAPLVDRQARSLRERGAEVVLVAAHAGASCQRDDISRCDGEIIEMAARLTERVDGIVAGHLHRPASTTVNGAAITQAYTKGTAIGIIDIPLETRGERARTSLRNVMPDSSPRNAEAARMVAPVTERARAEFAERVVRIAEPLRRGTAGNLGNLIADSQRWAARGDIALMNSGGVRVDLAPGWVTEGDIFNVLPFDNVLMRISVRGAELREYLERIIARNTTQFHLSGIVVEFDSSRPPGARLVRAVLSDGRPLDPRREYTLILSDFLMAGGDGLGLSERASSVEDTGILFRRALSRYLRTLPQPVREPTDRRLIRR